MYGLENNPQVVKFVQLLGVQETLVTENGSQLVAESSKYFCNINGITHLRSVPYHPQSNEQVECFVDTFKRALLKGGGNHRTWTAYKTTPNPTIPERMSPAEAMFERPIRTIVATQNSRCYNHKVDNKVFVRFYLGKKQ